MSHSYNEEGTYTVSLTVTDNNGESNTDSISVTITASDDNESECYNVGGENDDLTKLGIPPTKLSYTIGLENIQGEPDHFDYDTENYTVRTEMIHGTELTVAVHNSNNSAATFIDNVFCCFHAAWHVFGGFAYDKYAVKLRDVSDSSNFSLSDVGVSVSNDLFSGGGYEAVCHEIFHSWIGKLVNHEPDGSSNLFQLETWISEGSAVYYGHRTEGQARGISYYTDGMEDRFEDYEEIKGTSLDLSIQELADEIGNDFSSPAMNVLYGRAGLINYALDKELIAQGSNLDALMSYLYVNFGLNDTNWKQDDIPDAIESLTGERMDSFFDAYVLTNAELPLDGNFEFFER